MTSKRAKEIIVEFWNSEIPGREEHEIRTVATALHAVRECDLIGKVAVLKKNNQIYLINKVLVEQAKLSTGK